MPQVTRLSRATVVGFRGSPMGPRPPAAGVGWGWVISTSPITCDRGLPLGRRAAYGSAIVVRALEVRGAARRPPLTLMSARRLSGGGRSALRGPVVVQRCLNLADVDVDARQRNEQPQPIQSIHRRLATVGPVHLLDLSGQEERSHDDEAEEQERNATQSLAVVLLELLTGHVDPVVGVDAASDQRQERLLACLADLADRAPGGRPGCGLGHGAVLSRAIGGLPIGRRTESQRQWRTLPRRFRRPLRGGLRVHGRA